MKNTVTGRIFTLVYLLLFTIIIQLSGCGMGNYGYNDAWKTYTSKDTDIAISYPQSWTLSTTEAPTDKYSTLHIASLNSFGKNPFWLQTAQPRPNNWFYISEKDINEIPASGAYIEVGRLDPTKMILGQFPLVKGKGLNGAEVIKEGPFKVGDREYDKYLVEFRTDDIHYFYIFAYLTDDARTGAKPILDRFIKSVTVLKK